MSGSLAAPGVAYGVGSPELPVHRGSELGDPQGPSAQWGLSVPWPWQAGEGEAGGQRQVEVDPIQLFSQLGLAPSSPLAASRKLRGVPGLSTHISLHDFVEFGASLLQARAWPLRPRPRPPATINKSYPCLVRGSLHLTPPASSQMQSAELRRPRTADAPRFPLPPTATFCRLHSPSGL